MAEMLHLIMAGYDDPGLAHADYDELKKLNRRADITIDGMALVTRDADGQIKVKKSGDDDDSVIGGTMFGLAGGFALGLFFPPAILASTLVGAGLGAFGGRLVRHHQEKGIAADLETVLPAGGNAVIAVAEPRYTDRVKDSLARADRSALKEADADDADALKKALKEAAAKQA